MLNRYPLWKYLLILVVLTFGVVFALPNLYPPDAAVQIAPESSAENLSAETVTQAVSALNAAGIPVKSTEAGSQGSSALIRLQNAEQQLHAKEVIQQAVGHSYVVALNLAPTTPEWLSQFGAEPMKLGLDLSGGVHFLLEVDTQAALSKRLATVETGIKRKLREARIRGLVRLQDDGSIMARFADNERRVGALELIREEFPQLQVERLEQGDEFLLRLFYSESEIRSIEEYAVAQNLTTLRNRVNELGVAEPLVQRQGRNRIVVELPGVQDTAAAKRILGKTANLEFRLEARPDAAMGEREEFEFRSPDYARSAYLERDIVITGERVSNAQAGFDENGRPQVNISLDSEGGAMMHRVTRHNIKRRLGVLFIERKSRSRTVVAEDGSAEVIRVPYDDKRIISLATIQSALGAQFRITGLDSPNEASELALLLRAGALAAPMEFVEERTVGPSLGAENIQLGIVSVQIGMALVVLFMILWYRVFGLVAVLALTANLVLLVAVMSLISATLTLPGIAGIVLTVGMAVDANVLIFARIREELANRASPQQAIHAGYERAFTTIVDANITTLLVAVILYAVGTGPVRGFAVTLSVGILTSMFTAIMGTRALINLIYGGRKLEKLSI